MLLGMGDAINIWFKETTKIWFRCFVKGMPALARMDDDVDDADDHNKNDNCMRTGQHHDKFDKGRAATVGAAVRTESMMLPRRRKLQVHPYRR
mmetsp:Transcript_89650/g.196452  ORF Transcript_89650/g.196452 Transcript_89650/m.196452 type:complete len:93 (-) Transcript_89650:228-506(-)